jgi:glyoxylase-like metal-dependent hydrolase (beta-lactamase superfamily II)
VQRGEWDYATHPNERTGGSYLPPNFVPLAEAGALDLVDGEAEVVPGVRLVPAPGHTPHHAVVRVDSAGETLAFLADLVPTAAHLPLPWIMGYDVEPLVTLETKRQVLGRAEAEGWLLAFEHDAQVAWGRLRHDGRQYALAPIRTPRTAVDPAAPPAYPSGSQFAKRGGRGAAPTLRPRASARDVLATSLGAVGVQPTAARPPPATWSRRGRARGRGAGSSDGARVFVSLQALQEPDLFRTRRSASASTGRSASRRFA